MSMSRPVRVPTSCSPAPHHHGDEGADVALFQDDVAQGTQGQSLGRMPPVRLRRVAQDVDGAVLGAVVRLPDSGGQHGLGWAERAQSPPRRSQSTPHPFLIPSSGIAWGAQCPPNPPWCPQSCHRCPWANSPAPPAPSPAAVPVPRFSARGRSQLRALPCPPVKAARQPPRPCHWALPQWAQARGPAQPRSPSPWHAAGAASPG